MHCESRPRRGIALKDHAFDWIGCISDPPGFQKHFINELIGYGVFTVTSRCKGEFLLEYPGTLKKYEEAVASENEYKKTDKGSFMFYFNYDNKRMCVDGTLSSKLGVLVNDSPNPNCSMKVKVVDGCPFLCLYALQDIDSGKELRYDYGASNLWWRKETKSTRKPFNINELLKNNDVKELHSAIVPGVPALDHQDNDTSKTITGGADKNAVVFNKENEQGLHSEIDPGVPALDHQDNDSSKTISSGADKNAVVFNKENEQIEFLNIQSFKELQVIGEGQFAKVSKAVDVMSNQVVAFRTLKLTEAASLSLKRFKREGSVLKSICHPNIVCCIGIMKSPKTFVLEYCEQLLPEDGALIPVHSLSGVLNILENDMQVYSKLKVLYDVSYGLAHLHSLGIIAGDIKPSNILINNSWVFKIADFSVETVARHKSIMFSTTVKKASLDYTLYYLAPELMAEESTNCDKTSKTDIYSFAVMAFEVLFPGLSFRIHHTASQHMQAVKSGWRPKIPKSFDEIILKLINLCKLSWDEKPDNRLEASMISKNVKELMIHYLKDKTKKNNSYDYLHTLQDVEQFGISTRKIQIQEVHVEVEDIAAVKNIPDSAFSSAKESTDVLEIKKKQDVFDSMYLSTPKEKVIKKEKNDELEKPRLKTSSGATLKTLSSTALNDPITSILLNNTISNVNANIEFDRTVMDENVGTDIFEFNEPDLETLQTPRRLRPRPAIENQVDNIVENMLPFREEDSGFNMSDDEDDEYDDDMPSESDLNDDDDDDDYEPPGLVDVTDDEDDTNDNENSDDEDYINDDDNANEFEEADILQVFENDVTHTFNKENEIDHSAHHSYSNHESESDSDIDDPIFSGTKDNRVLSDVFNQAERNSSGHKKHWCLYCCKFKDQITRHLKRNHGDKIEVIEALSFPVKSKDRREEWQKIIRQGDFQANIESLKMGKSNFVVVREGRSTSRDNYVPCPHCCGFFSTKMLYKHSNNCFMKRTEGRDKVPVSTGRSMLSTAVIPNKFSDLNSFVLNKMKRDDLYLIIKNDEFLCLFGNIQMQQKQKVRYHDIRYSLRALAKLLKQVRFNTGNAALTSDKLVEANMFDEVVTASKELSGYKGPRDIAVPNIFLKTGYCLRNLMLTVRTAAIKESNQSKIDNLGNFTKLYETEWQIFAKNCRAVYDARKANQPEILPDEDDMKLFRKYCLQELSVLIRKVKSGDFSQHDFKRMEKIALARVISFNARRGSEASQLTLKIWEGVEDDRWKQRFSVNKIEDEIERKLAERLKICYVEGKNKQGAKSALVPILFTDEMVEAIRLLIKHRSLANVTGENDYIFASGELFMRGWDTLQAVAKQIDGLKYPNLITPTRTRKFLATSMQLLDMNEAELTWLTSHMGHTVNVHYAWYRKEDSHIELTKVAKVLTALDKGRNIQNKKIDNCLEEDDCSDNSDDNSNNMHQDEEVPSRTTFRKKILSTKKRKSKSKELERNNDAEVVAKKQKTWAGWTSEETAALKKALHVNFKLRRVPLHQQILVAMKNFPILKTRGVSKIKDKFRSELKKL